jgi:alanine transaminase
MAAANGNAPKAPPLSVGTIDPRVVRAEYAVRGEIVRRASAIEAELRGSKQQYPFNKIIWCNIGNPQILGQKPITYFRQILCLCEYPQLLQEPAALQLFPADVVARAKEFLAEIPGGIGAYSDSAGALVLRKQIAAAIERRDGFPCDPEELYLTVSGWQLPAWPRHNAQGCCLLIGTFRLPGSRRPLSCCSSR